MSLRITWNLIFVFWLLSALKHGPWVRSVFHNRSNVFGYFYWVLPHHLGGGEERRCVYSIFQRHLFVSNVFFFEMQRTTCRERKSIMKFTCFVDCCRRSNVRHESEVFYKHDLMFCITFICSLHIHWKARRKKTEWIKTSTDFFLVGMSFFGIQKVVCRWE